MYSIIVPIYKVEKYLPQCIESILSQTYTDFELILVDDGSPDNCPKICDEYAAKDNRIKVIHKENGGSVSARKLGVHFAKGDYICFVDGDDFIANDMLENYENVLSKQKVDIICTGYSRYYNENKIITVNQIIKSGFYSKNQLIEHIYPKMLSTEPFYTFYIAPTVWSKCFRRTICEESNNPIPENISLGDDVAVVYHALLLANSINVIDYCGYMYRENPNSMTHTYDKKLYEKIKTLIIYLKDVVQKTNWQVKNQINEYTTMLLIHAKSNELQFNITDTHHNKKQNLKQYLNDPLFKEALKKTKTKNKKIKFIIWCLKSKFLLPFYIHEKLLQKRKKP